MGPANTRVLFQYVTQVVKYDRNGFKPRERQLVFTTVAAYVVEMAKIKQRIEYATLKGNGPSPLPRPCDKHVLHLLTELIHPFLNSSSPSSCPPGPE